MKEFKHVQICGDYDWQEYNFVCYENTEHISIGDKYLFFFCGRPAAEICRSENEEFEINENDYKSKYAIDFTSGFWRNCYKIKETNYKFED